MFASLAASAEMDTILYCVQGAVEVMAKGAIEKNEKVEPGSPTLKDRLEEALELGVKVQTCTQTMKNKKIETADLVDGVEPAGAMSLISIATAAQGILSF
jgi:predicted peroxiredoxin